MRNQLSTLLTYQHFSNLKPNRKFLKPLSQRQPESYDRSDASSWRLERSRARSGSESLALGVMRSLLLILVLPFSALAEAPFDDPYSSPESTFAAHFSTTLNRTTKSSGTTVTIKDRAGKIVFSDSIPDRVAVGARWTEDGKFLVIPTTSGGGHSPWHYLIYIFSTTHHQVRWLDDSDGPPIVSSEVWCQKPDTIILVGHDFSHGISAPDDPLLLRYKVSELWKKLK